MIDSCCAAATASHGATTIPPSRKCRDSEGRDAIVEEERSEGRRTATVGAVATTSLAADKRNGHSTATWGCHVITGRERAPLGEHATLTSRKAPRGGTRRGDGREWRHTPAEKVRATHPRASTHAHVRIHKRCLVWGERRSGAADACTGHCAGKAGEQRDNEVGINCVALKRVEKRATAPCNWCLDHVDEMCTRRPAAVRERCREADGIIRAFAT